MSYLSPTQTRAATETQSLPAAVGADLALLEARVGQSAGLEARQRLADLDEASAARVLRKIAESRMPVKNLGGFVKFMAEKEMERNARGIPPAESSSAPSRGGSTNPDGGSSYGLFGPACCSFGRTPAMMPVSTLPWMAGEKPSDWIRLLNLDYTRAHAMAPFISPQSPASASNTLRKRPSPQMLALEELEFRKIFMIFAYLSIYSNKLEDELSVDDIRSLKSLSMVHFESEIWSKFGYRYISTSDRAKNLDSDPGTPRVYHCNVEIIGDSVVKVFKGPYVENTRTHLQKVVGDDNVLIVKFMGESSDKKTDSKTDFLPYDNVAEDGIGLGLRRYRFFLYKDGGKEEKQKEEKRKGKNKKCTSAMRCYFIRTESGWNMDEPYILSGKTVDQARKLFMHIHTAPTLSKYMARFALILSKTITLEVDLSAVHVIQLDDKPCSDEHGNIVHRDGEPLIHTDGTGLISEDLAMKCPTSILKGNFLKSQDVAAHDEILMTSPISKKHRSIAAEPPLLMQFRMFYKGSAVKGTALVDKRLPPGTILVRPSMIKINSDPKLCGIQSINSSELIKMRNDPILGGVQSINSLEVVTTSYRPKRTLTSKYLIPLLHYGGVKAEYFIELLHNAIEEAENARYDNRAALNIAFIYADMEDSISARMILCGIPLEDAYLQHRLAFFAKQERKGIKKGKLPIDDCFYLMGTTDPTGKLKPNEVCVILDQGQYSGNVLVYKPPGIHFGDIHVLTARYIEDIEKVVGYSKYGILFPTCGPRSLADEMANSDFDGDMYWVSINAKLLEQFKPSEPWVQAIKPKKPQQKVPMDFDESQLERELFREFLRKRFAPSYALSAAANYWLAYMDRLLTDGVDKDEKKLLEEKMKKLVDLYYLALDAPKTGEKINIPVELMKKGYPHFMEKNNKNDYQSTSILGKIYDEADRAMLQKSKNDGPILLDPCFTERAASPAHKQLWDRHYEEYLTDSKLLMDRQNKGLQDNEETSIKFEELYLRYKHMLYYAAEFEQARGTSTMCSTRPVRFTRLCTRKHWLRTVPRNAALCGRSLVAHCATSTPSRARVTRSLS